MAGAAGQTAVFDNLSAITRDVYLPGLVDNIFNSNVLFRRLRNKSEFLNGGEFIRQPLLYAKQSAGGSYDAFDVLDTTPTENISNAVLPWSHYYVNVSLAETDLLKNAGDEQVLSLLKAQLKIAEMTMGDNIGTGLYDDGSDSKGIVGLREIVSDSTTYGGVNPSTYSWWKSTVNSTARTKATLATAGATGMLNLLRDMWGDLTIDRDHPTILVTTQDIFDIFWTYFQTAEVQNRPPQDAGMANMGFQFLNFNGVPMVVDDHCPAGYLFMLNENYLHLKIHSDDNFRLEDFQKPTNQRVHIGKLFFSGQLVSSNRRMQGVFTDWANS